MLLKEQMKAYPFSHNERVIIDYILDKQINIKDYSVKMIADATFTSPSTLIRISKKLGFQGWVEFKDAYLEEANYLNSHFCNIDSNLPFSNQDSIMTIASKIVNLHIESAKDTLSLFQHDSLQKAVRILHQSKEIRVFAMSNLNFAGEEFVFKLNRIHKKAYIHPIQDNLFHDAAMSSPDECAICIPYSGESSNIVKTAQILKENNCPIIAITSIGNNSLSDLATVTLRVTTREKSFSKIAGFSSLESISIVLNTLYACLFSLNYHDNLTYKLDIAKKIENAPIINNEIIAEKDDE